MKKKHFNIPIFIPELACPFQCIYCNQCKISGQIKLPDQEEIKIQIRSYLKTMNLESSEVQVAYFGGNFTGIPIHQQEQYLKIIQPFISSGHVSGIRLSTRPDYINKNVLELLKKYHVESIELGAQSLDDEVLIKSKRGHKAIDTEIASKMILDFGFSLGLQMMIGLPGDSLDKSIYTAKKIIELKAENTRIYPTLVIKDTILEKMFQKKEYFPLKLEEAVKWSKELMLLFEKANVAILKLGLHPSEGLLSGSDLIAGPFHVSFRELVLTEIWHDILSPLYNSIGESIEIEVPEKEINFAIGYEGKNKKQLERYYSKVKFTGDNNLKRRSFKYKINSQIKKT